MDWYAEMWLLSTKLSPSRGGGQDLSVACPRSMALCAVRGVRMAHAKKQRRKENREPVCVMLGAERWVSRSLVNCADARGVIWDVEVVEEITGRPLHHTLLIVESQQAVLSVVQCPSLLHPPAPYSRLKPKA